MVCGLHSLAGVKIAIVLCSRTVGCMQSVGRDVSTKARGFCSALASLPTRLLSRVPARRRGGTKVDEEKITSFESSCLTLFPSVKYVRYIP